MATYLLALRPKYRECRPASRSAMPLGTILIADLRTGIRAILDAAARLEKEPWYPLILASPSALDYTTGALVRHYGLEQAVFVKGGRGFLGPRSVLTRIRSRSTPGPDVLATYVAGRTGRRDLHDILCDSFGRGMSNYDSALSRSTLSRRLSGFGPLKARDWAAVGKVIDYLTARGNREPTGAEGRRLRTHVFHYTGMATADARLLAGWEWVLETVLRNWSYLGTGAGKAGASNARMG